MLCPKCRTNLSEDAKFCPECGENLSKQNVNKKAEEQPKQNNKNWLNKIIVLVVLVIIIFWILLSRFYFINEDGSSVVTRCNKITGNCVKINPERIK